MKLIKTGIFLVAVLAAVSSFAQQKGTGFIGISGGVSVPIGNWGRASTASSLTSLNGTINDVSGYAGIGGYGAVNGAWLFSKHFAIGAMIQYGIYNLHGMDSLSYGYEKSFDVDTTRLTHTNYKIWTIMPGLYYNLTLAKKLSLTADALIGVAHASTPQITVTIEDGGVFDPPVIQYSASKTSLSWDVGAGLRYSITKCLAVGLKADYFYTKPDFNINNSSRISNAAREVSSYNQPLSSENVSAGIAYIFGKK